MANITVTYSFTNSTTADASQINTCFSDIISGTSDGSKDFSINALTCAGAATFNGTVNLGNATGDDVTFTGYVASTIIPKTNATYDLGSSALAWQNLYLDDGSNHGGRIYFDAGTTEYIGSSADGTDFQFAGFTGLDLAGANIKEFGLYSAALSDSYTVTDSDGYSVLLVTTGVSDRTITLPTAADNSGRVLSIKKVDSGAGKVIIDGEGAETIDGATTVTLIARYESITITCNGTAWFIIDANWISGVYTPTDDNLTNCTGVTPLEAQYTRNNKIVTVYGSVSSIAVSGSGADTRFSLSLPIATASFTAAAQSNGVVMCGKGGSSAKDSGYVYAAVNAQLIYIEWETINVTGTNYAYYSYQYQIQ
jgi:hypothetical protein